MKFYYEKLYNDNSSYISFCTPALEIGKIAFLNTYYVELRIFFWVLGIAIKLNHKS